MIQEYFIYNGKRYLAGTLIYVKWVNHLTCTLCKTLATFCSYNPDNKTYIFEIDGYKYTYSEKDFYDILCGIYGETSSNLISYPRIKQLTFEKELAINGLLIAWIWYIFIMAVAIIFKDCIGIWIIASIVFFTYRNKKLKEAGYK